MAIDLEEEKEREDPTEDAGTPGRAAYRPAMAAPIPDQTQTPGFAGGRPGYVRDSSGLMVPTSSGGDAAMGNAVIQPSPAAKDLGEFAAATGTAKPAATQTPLQSLAPAPQPPATNPELAKTEADFRAHATPTPKYDPATGKTLDQYHPGVGGRIGRAFLDLVRGGLPGVAEGAMGDRSQPGYYGPGAVNSQYFRDEWARKQAEGADQKKIDSLQREDTTAQRDFKNKDAAYKDDTRRAYEQTTTEERARHQQETEQMTQQQRETQQQLADTKQQLADAKDPAAKLNAEIDARGGIAKRLGLKGQAAQDYILYGDKAGMVGVDRIKIRQEEDKLGIERDKAAKGKKDVNDLGYTPDEQRGINVEAPGAMKRLQDLESERAKNIGAQMDTKTLDADIAATRKTIQDAAEKVRNTRTAPVQKPGAGRPQPGATPTPAAPGSKGTVTRSQIQAAVDKFNASNPPVKATYEGQKKNAVSRGFNLDESK